MADIRADALAMGLRAYARVNILGKTLHLLGESHRERMTPAPADVIRKARERGVAVFLEQRLDRHVTRQEIGLRGAMLECGADRPGRCTPVDARQGYLPGRKGWDPAAPPDYESYLAECREFVDATRPG